MTDLLEKNAELSKSKVQKTTGMDVAQEAIAQLIEGGPKILDAVRRLAKGEPPADEEITDAAKQIASGPTPDAPAPAAE